MFFSFQKRRAAAPRLAKSRVRTSRRLLVEGLEERRVMAADFDFLAIATFTQDDKVFTTAEDVVIPLDLATTTAESELNVTWYLFSDDALLRNETDEFFIATPGNFSADLNPNVVGDDIGAIIDSPLLPHDPQLLPVPSQADPFPDTPKYVVGNAATVQTATFRMSASAINSLRPDDPNSDLPFLAVARISTPDGRYQWIAQPFEIDPDVGSLAVDPIDGPAGAIIGQPLEFTSGVSGTETAPDDLVHTWMVTNQQTSVVVGTGSDASLNFTPTTPGTYVVSYSVNDGTIDASADPVLLSVTASSFAAGQLAFGTATGGSNVVVNQSGSSTAVTMAGVTTNYTGVQGITIYGQAGNDIVIIGSNVTAPVTIFGGAGNDILTGGSGADILVGGAGTDALVGGGGRDLIIGGDGADILIGSADDDIIIGGYTNRSADQLAVILATWTGSGNFASRVSNLRASSLNQSTVFDDDDIDLLSGNAGSDWFFANLMSDNQSGDRRDLILDRTAAEFARYQELANET
jgi:hypothetical protein